MDKLRCAAAIALLAGISASSADAARLSFSAGGQYSNGDYGAVQDTLIFYEFVSVRYSTTPWLFKVTLPFLQVDGPAAVTDDGDIEGTGVSRSVSGMGDMSLSATYTVPFDAEHLYLDLTGRVRLPTGDEDKGLGTGETDFIALATLTKEFGGLSIFAEGGRRFLGSSAVRPRRDGWAASAGLWQRVDDDVQVGATIDWHDASTHFAEDPAEVTAFVRFGLTDSVRMNVYAFAGLSDGSADAGTGLSFTWRTQVD